MEKLLEDIFAVPVPMDATDFVISNAQYPDNDLLYDKNKFIKTLPSGSWQILFSTQSASEEDWKKINLEQNEIGLKYRVVVYYKDYTREEMQFLDARYSGESLLQSHGLDTNKNWLILKSSPQKNS